MLRTNERHDETSERKHREIQHPNQMIFTCEYEHMMGGSTRLPQILKVGSGIPRTTRKSSGSLVTPSDTRDMPKDIATQIPVFGLA